MRIKHLIEGLNAQQRSVPQLPAQARARHISVLGAKTDPKHPFAGYMVGADESAEPGQKRIGPDKNDPWEKGWRAGFRQNEFNPYPAGSKEARQWDDGYAEARAQPRHYDESVANDMPDLEAVGEPVRSMMDAERRMAAGDRIFAAHEMDEEPFEIFDVGDLKGYTYDQLLAVPQDIAEGRAGVDDRDTVGFSVNSEKAYTAVMRRFGDYIDHDETSGIMYAPARIWPQIEMTAFDADPEGAVRVDDDMSEATGDKPFDSMMQNISKGTKKQAAVDKKDQKKQSQQQARDAFGSMFGGGNPAGNLKIREQGVAEEKLDEKCWDGYEKKGMKTMFGKRVPNCVKNEGADRNELDTPAVQAALAKMAERHRGEKWSKEQLAALGKRIAARGQTKKGVREGEITRTPTGLIHKGKYGTSHYDTTSNKDDAVKAKVGRPPKSAGRDVSIDEPKQIRRNQPGYMDKSPRITNPDAPRSPVRKTGPIAGGGLGIDLPKHVQDRIFAQSDFDRIKANPGIMRVKPKDDGVAILDLDEGWKSKVAGAALAGAAALGGGAAAAHDHGDYGHYDQRLDDRSWDTAGYDDHIKSDTKLTKTTTPDGKVSRDSQSRISSVQGPNAQGLYRVFVGQNGKIVSSYITKTPPQNWMVKEDVTKEDIITKLKARLGDYLSDLSKEIKSDPDLIDKLAAKAPGDQMGPPVKTVTTDDGHEIQIHGNEDDGFRISIKNKQSTSKFKNLDEAVMACEMYCAQRRAQAESADYIDEAGKDACYHKVKSRYKIWPSAYASGALVRCRKVGADNWGNKSKK